MANLGSTLGRLGHYREINFPLVHDTHGQDLGSSWRRKVVLADELAAFEHLAEYQEHLRRHHDGQTPSVTGGASFSLSG
jgi:hypothetical protein